MIIEKKKDQKKFFKKKTSRNILGLAAAVGLTPEVSTGSQRRMNEVYSSRTKSIQVTSGLVNLSPHIAVGPRNLTEPLLRDGISHIAMTMTVLLDTILSKLSLRCPCSLFQPPLTVMDMSHVVSQSLAHFWAIHIVPHVP